MESTEELAKTTPESQVSGNTRSNNVNFLVEMALRLSFFVLTFIAFIVMVSSKQTKVILTLIGPVSFPAEFSYSPAFVHFVVALSIACFYSVVSILILVYVSPNLYPVNKRLFHSIVMDAIILGLVASATGTAGAVGYIGLKGNSHTGWTKVCDVYDTFCQHIASSAALSLIASIVLVTLVTFSTYSLYRGSS